MICAVLLFAVMGAVGAWCTVDLYRFEKRLDEHYKRHPNDIILGDD